MGNYNSKSVNGILNLTIRASFAPGYAQFLYTIFTQSQKVKDKNPKIQITTRGRRKRKIGRFSFSTINKP